MTVPALDLCPPDGPKLSRLVAGAWRLDRWNYTPAQLRDWMTACLDNGITSFDHADIYGDHTCERLFGDAWADMSVPRESVQLVSKCGIALATPNRPRNRVKHYDTSADHIVASARASLKHLRTDYLDVLLLHRPDPLLNAEEVSEAFDVLRDAGDVRFLGVSNFTPRQYEVVQSRLDGQLVTNQLELSVLALGALADGTLDQAQERGFAPMAWSPLGGGRLFDGSERSARVVAALEQVGGELGGATVEQVALAWLLRHPAKVVPVLGTGKPERIRLSAAACGLTMDRQQWFMIWSASAGQSVP